METVKKKIKIFRMSGHPVKIKDLDDYADEFKRLYDIAIRVCKNDMLRLNKKLTKVEQILSQRYPSIQEIDECVTGSDWEALLNEYGNVMVSRHRDTNELLYIIVDINGVPGL